MRPTVKDLAREAGVSLSTVDRVLNERPNVSRETAAKVNEAIARIDFVRNIAAANLARRKTYRYRFVLPGSGDEYLRELLDRVAEAGAALHSDLTVVETVQIPSGDPHLVANHLASVGAGDLDGVAVMAPESPQVRDAMARLFQRGIKVVQFLSGQEKLDDLDFVGVDNFAAGATAGRIVGRFLGGARGKVMVISETMRSLDSIERRHGFDEVINSDFTGLTVLPSLETHGDARHAERIVGRVFGHQEDVVALYVMSSEARIPLLSAAAAGRAGGLTTVVHERTPFSEEALRSEKIDAIIAQDPGHAVRSAIRILRARTDGREILASQEKLRIEVLLKENL